MKLVREGLCFLISLAACAMVACTAQTAGTNAHRADGGVQKNADDITTQLRMAFDPANAQDAVHMSLGKVHMMIPRGYLANGPFATQATDHLVLDVQLPDIRPMTKEELSRYATTERMLPNTAHIILEASDRYLHGDKLFETFIREPQFSSPPYSYLLPEASGIQDVALYHHKDGLMDQDVYLLKDSSPKFFFVCTEVRKFVAKPTCKYFGDLTGNIRFQIWYRSDYFNDIVKLTPKIRALLLSFIKPSVITNAPRTDGDVQKHTNDTMPPHMASSLSHAPDLTSVKLDKLHLEIPRGYIVSWPFDTPAPDNLDLQAYDNLDMEVQLPDLQPMTKEELNQYATTGQPSPNMVDINLQARNDKNEDEDFESLIRGSAKSGAGPLSPLLPEASGIPNLVLYRDKTGSSERDVYLLKDSSPKIFFECNVEYKSVSVSNCAYFGSLVGNIRMAIFFDKNKHINDIVKLAPKIKTFLLNFVKL